MSAPALTNTQHAYLFRREAFLADMEARATRLWEDGYFVMDDPFSPEPRFSVFTPSGHSYDIDWQAQTCTCPFFIHQVTAPLDTSPVACKHLRGLPQLIEETLHALYQQERYLSCQSLRDAWKKAQIAQTPCRSTP